MDYDKLPESFIIFICNFDQCGKGLAKYERVSYYKGTDDEYNDGSHVILLETQVYGQEQCFRFHCRISGLYSR